MNRKWFDQQWDGIEVPQDETFAAIRKGIDQGKKEKMRRKKKSRLKATTVMSSTAAAVFLASGLFFSPMTEVMADVPLLGPIYEKLHFDIGKHLSDEHLVTSLHEKATDNGVSVTLTSAYFDGNVIGVTFKAQGNGLSEDAIDSDQGPDTGYEYYLFDGNEQKQWSGSMAGLKKTNQGFIGAMEFYSPKEQLPKNFSLPLTFTFMAGQKGTWKFDVPVKQIPPERINIENAQSTTKNGDYSIIMDSVDKGKATTILNYTTIRPGVGHQDTIRINAFDDKGKPLSKSHGDVLGIKKKNGTVQIRERFLFTSKISDDAKYLMVYPEVVKDEQDTFKTMKKATPFEIKSKRFNYKMVVNKIKRKGDRLIVDFHLKNVDTNHFKKDVIQNFADMIEIAKSDSIKIDGSGEPEDYSGFLSARSKMINEKTLHVQTVFNIKNPNEFNYRDYSLKVRFGIFSGNDPIKMDPIKIDLKTN